MSQHSSSDEIYNGAQCKIYSWCQNHSDLEIKIKLERKIKREHLRVTISQDGLKVELDDPESNLKIGSTTRTIMEGKFENRVDLQSACWSYVTDDSILIIFIDKVESMWWKQLLVDEEVTQTGPKNFIVPMDQIDDGSRMVIDKLIVEQRNKIQLKS